MRYRYVKFKIRVRYYDVRASIFLVTKGKLFKLKLAGKCLRLANWLSPELMENYDRAVIRYGRVRF